MKLGSAQIRIKTFHECNTIGKKKLELLPRFALATLLTEKPVHQPDLHIFRKNKQPQYRKHYVASTGENSVDQRHFRPVLSRVELRVEGGEWRKGTVDAVNWKARIGSGFEVMFWVCSRDSCHKFGRDQHFEALCQPATKYE